jgi:uncharacterized protein YkwD
MRAARLRRLLGLALPLAALALSRAGSLTPAHAAAPGTMTAKEAAYAAELVRLTLQERRERNLTPLGEHAALTRAAVRYAQFLARPGIPLSHTGDGSTPSQRASAEGYQKGAFYAASAENIASGYPTAAQCFAGWMASPGHRGNITTDMSVPTASRRHLAVGVCIANGKTIAVQMFGVQQILTHDSRSR